MSRRLIYKQMLYKYGYLIKIIYLGIFAESETYFLFIYVVSLHILTDFILATASGFSDDSRTNYLISCLMERQIGLNY